VKPLLAGELALFTLLAAALGAALGHAVGHFGWSWDALNHHVYLGHIAEHPRWQLDVVAASYQSYQYPYLYWPVYRMSLMTGEGALVGAAWSALQAALLLLPVWLLSHRLQASMPLAPWERPLARAAACALALMSIITLQGLVTTTNDVLATLPLLWALALFMGNPASDRRAALCAGLWGVSVAFKWSNGLMLPILLFWWWRADKPHLPLRRGLGLALGAAAGFAITWLPWGWQLWQQTGNPFYPYFQRWFGGY
jgi:hypothetical protein